MKTTVTLEFDSPEAASAALSRFVGSNPAPTNASANVHLAPQPMNPPQPMPQAAQPQYQHAQPPSAPPPQYQPVNMPPTQQYAAPPAPPSAPPLAPQQGNGYTQAQVAQAAQAYAKTHGAKAAKAKLGEFGITAIGQANPAAYPQLMQAFTLAA